VIHPDLCRVLLDSLTCVPSPHRLQGWNDPMLWLVDDPRCEGGSHAFSDDRLSTWRTVGHPQVALFEKTTNGFRVLDRVWDGPFWVNGALLARGSKVVAWWARTSRVELRRGDTLCIEDLTVTLL
jgi:hypothetical protein